METHHVSQYRPRRDFRGMERRRLKAAHLFEKGITQAEVARRLGVSRQAVHVWFVHWDKGGKRALSGAGRAGRKPRLTGAQLRVVEAALLKGPQANGLEAELWSLPRIAEVIAGLTGVRYHSGHVWRVMRTLGWSAQKPQSKARERDENAIYHWKTRTWPAVKKKPKRRERS
jgi:transposase